MSIRPVRVENHCVESSLFNNKHVCGTPNFLVAAGYKKRLSETIRTYAAVTAFIAWSLVCAVAMLQVSCSPDERAPITSLRVNEKNPMLSDLLALNPAIASGRTPSGRHLSFLAAGTTFFIQWHDGTRLRTVPETFWFNSSYATYPIFHSEDSNFILMKAGCGTSCWDGYFLPLHATDSAYRLHNYQLYDTARKLVVYLENEFVDSLDIINLKTGAKAKYKLNVRATRCHYPFECLDTLYFEQGNLIYTTTMLSSAAADSEVSNRILVSL